MPLCDYQPHPLRFVWTFLAAGLVRSHTHAVCSGRSRLWLRFFAGSAAADLLSFGVFENAVAPALLDVSSVVRAWLLCLACGFCIRSVVAQQCSSCRSRAWPDHLLLSTTALGLYAAAALSSTLVFLLSMLLLKQELQERGAALDAARYSWHIATFFLGAIFAPLCAPRLQLGWPSMGCDGDGDGGGEGRGSGGRAHHSTLSELSLALLSQPSAVRRAACVGQLSPRHVAIVPHATQHAASKRMLPAARAQRRGLKPQQEPQLKPLRTPPQAAPFGVSAVALGALGLLPSALRLVPAPQRSPHIARRLRGLHAIAPALLLPLLCAAALVGYLGAVRLLVSPAATAGPFLLCGAAEAAAAERTVADKGARAAAQEETLGAEAWNEAGWTEDVVVGRRWSLLGLMYGRRVVRIPPRAQCKPRGAARHTSASASAGSAGATTGSTGIVMTADGSNAKYADAVYVGLHGVRTLHRSPMPVEVFHVGASEAFAPAAAERLEALGGVHLLDLLQRLDPRLRPTAAHRLRSFAAKAFALLATSFERAILMDANVLFFAPPEELLQMPSFTDVGVQLFNDYVPAFHIVDPWLISSYLAASGAGPASYVRLTQGAECDSSVVVVDTVRAWRYLQVVAALNWWKRLVDRHAWGDKDTWALAALVLWPGAESTAAAAAAVSGREGGAEHASTAGSTVGWLGATGTEPPSAVWGHVQFARGDGAANRSRLLYLNWQPHYAAGFIELRGEQPPSASLECCVLLEEHWAGPHLEEYVQPSMPRALHAAALDRTFGDASSALRQLGVELQRPHWWGQVRYRRCLIYFGVLAAGLGLLVASLAQALRMRRAPL